MGASPIRPQGDYLVDRQKVDAPRGVEPICTNGRIFAPFPHETNPRHWGARLVVLGGESWQRTPYDTLHLYIRSQFFAARGRPSSPGDSRGKATPVPIPNTVVKLSSADGTGPMGAGRVGRRQDPGVFYARSSCDAHLWWAHDGRAGNVSSVSLRRVRRARRASASTRYPRRPHRGLVPIADTSSQYAHAQRVRFGVFPTTYSLGAPAKP